ncbi:nuclear transport factor 2 family protein [Jeongeupia chitinilytica]|uniref:Lumazine-binding protein n=1 Tax=Jeongeupia chitinilytica TaxID=1041641 RepID=A0ABQ3H0B0_9NEIS|nr:nuclear transport factor 2 family protein [Jeongeupia chitinilytica]GHD60092.1 hypothetical protein GCM10007350_12510 [Jeongeupia chitinilytica]
MKRRHALPFMLWSAVALAGPAADRDAVSQVASNYLRAWYTGDGALMKTTLHPQLAKRMPTGKRNAALDDISASALVMATDAGYGKPAADDAKRNDVTVLDLRGDVAFVKVVGDRMTEYLQLARTDDGWSVVNVLFGSHS